MSKEHQLITIETNSINGEAVQTVNARALHEFLKVGKDFSNWIKDRTRQYGFVENIDYIIVENLSSPKLASAKSRQRPMKDYAISIDMAKELSMVERNEKGKQARQYFIECERRILQPQIQTSLPTTKELALMVIRAEEEKEQLLLLNRQQEAEIHDLRNLFREGMTATQFCKMLNGVNTQQVSHWLADRNWLYNESKSGIRWRATSYARDRYLTEHQHRVSVHGAEDFIKYQPVLLRKGAERIYTLYRSSKAPMKTTWNGQFTHQKALSLAS